MHVGVFVVSPSRLGILLDFRNRQISKILDTIALAVVLSRRLFGSIIIWINGHRAAIVFDRQ